MKFIINDQIILLRTPEGPLIPYCLAFEVHAYAGYTGLVVALSEFESLRVSWLARHRMTRCVMINRGISRSGFLRACSVEKTMSG